MFKFFFNSIYLFGPLNFTIANLKRRPAITIGVSYNMGLCPSIINANLLNMESIYLAFREALSSTWELGNPIDKAPQTNLDTQPRSCLRARAGPRQV